MTVDTSTAIRTDTRGSTPAGDATSAAVAPPQAEPRLGGPPMLSRDGRWWWTGSTWRPVPGPAEG